ncbi:MAG: DEAD/DEAH box helicase [Methanobacteriota archaeon]
MPGAFAELSQPLRTLLEETGFRLPTPAQEHAIPEILAGRDVLLIAPTGMGKTEAAVIPVFDEFLRGRRAAKGTSILYVTPLRALNRDLLRRLDEWGRRLKIDVRVRHGDTDTAERRRQAREPPDFLITTPETLQVMLAAPRLRGNLSGVRVVVVDEVHELAGDERGAQLAVALERLDALTGGSQRVGLSATVGDVEVVRRFLSGLGRAPATVVKVPVAKELSIRVEHPKPRPEDAAVAERIFAKSDAAAILRRSRELIDGARSTLVFVNTRESAEVVSARFRMLSEDGAPAVHHGSLSREARVEAEEAFKEGRARALVCTSSMELGIDVGSADLVIQLSSPREVTRIVQRVGRAGHRFDRRSNGVILAQGPDDVAESAVIARRAMAEALEPTRIPRSPLDVLANQLVALGLEHDAVRLDDVYAMVTKAAPFSELPRADFDAVARQLADLRLVAPGADVLRRRGRARPFFVENLSMIADVKTVRVRDVATRKSVAQLDEAFVAENIEPGALFICQGRAWRVVEAGDEEIKVAEAKDPTGAVPSWVGEEIPVPYEVAEEVGRLRGRTMALLKADGPVAARSAIQREYPVDEDAADAWIGYVAEQGALELPTHETFTLEVGDGRAILNACLGSRASETLGRLLSALLSARLGTSVGLDVDPYRVMLKLPGRVGKEAILSLLRETRPEAIEGLLDLLLHHTPYFRHRLIHVARRFGAIDKGADLRTIRLDKLAGLWRGTPLYEEALREVREEKLDVERAGAALRGIQDGSIRLVVQPLSPIGLAGLDTRIELVSPARATRTLLAAVKQRLLDEEVQLACLNCKAWRLKTRVKRATALRTCPKCDAVLITAFKAWHEQSLTTLEKVREKKRLSPEEKAEYKRLVTAADLVAHHRERALLALAGRGIGPETAGRLLARQREDEEAFLRDLLEAEMTYARTKAFWD